MAAFIIVCQPAMFDVTSRYAGVTCGWKRHHTPLLTTDRRVSGKTSTSCSCVNCKCGVTISFVGPALEVGVTVVTRTRCSCVNCKCEVTISFVGPALEVGVSVVTRTRCSCVNCKCGVTISFVGPALDVGVSVGTGTKCCSRSKHRFPAFFLQTAGIGYVPEGSLGRHLRASVSMSVCMSVCLYVCPLTLSAASQRFWY